MGHLYSEIYKYLTLYQMSYQSNLLGHSIYYRQPPSPPLRGPFIIPLGYKKFRTPLDAIFGSYPMDIFIHPLGYRFTPLDITKTPNFCYFFENLLSYPLGKFKIKTPPPPIGYPDPSIGGGGGAYIKWNGPF